MGHEKEVAGMRCGEVLEILSDYLDGDLSPERRSQVDAHLHGCDVCERFGTVFAAALQTLRQEKLDQPQEASMVFERLRLRLDQAPQRNIH
jgi:anti-sigma factor RsiW